MQTDDSLVVTIKHETTDFYKQYEKYGPKSAKGQGAKNGDGSRIATTVPSICEEQRGR